MNSRKLVIDSLELNQPYRIPRDLWTLPWAENKHPKKLKKIKDKFPNDIICTPSFYEASPITKGERHKKGIYIDEWGCIFENVKDGIIGEVKNPLIKDLNNIEKLSIPGNRLSIDIGKINSFCESTDKFVLPNVYQRLFERAQFIRKPVNFFTDLIESPDLVEKLLNKIHNFYLKEIELWCQTKVDGIYIMDDWGSQNSLLISPKMWKKFFKWRYREYIQLAHEYNKYVFMHSDGDISTIIPELIEIGLDALNAQLFCLDLSIEELGKKFKGEITFWGEIDRQYLLSFGSKKEIRTAVKTIYNNLYYRGGVIAQCEFGLQAKPENVEEVFKAWDRVH